MKLWAISDLHLNYERNREAIRELPERPDDWLILAGDLGDTLSQVEEAFRYFGERWARLVWVPGNHELWTHPHDPEAKRGVERYRQWVDLCRKLDVLCPEDEYPLWEGEGGPCWLAPLFLGFDYSFCAPEVLPQHARAWAAEKGIVSNDERYLHPDPFPDLPSWCAARLEQTEARLEALDPAHPMVLVNHYPLRYEFVRVYPHLQRFSVWCGTRATEDWHRRFRVRVAVAGHLHVRTTDWKDGTRFEEVALGYPRHWDQEKGAAAYLRQILPDPEPPPEGGDAPPVRHR